MSESEKDTHLEGWSIECSDDEKYEINTSWVTIGVSEVCFYRIALFIPKIILILII